MSPHFGPGKRPCGGCCLASSSAHSLWPASPPQTPGFIGASPTRREGANLTSDIPSGIYFSAYAGELPLRECDRVSLPAIQDLFFAVLDEQRVEPVGGKVRPEA